MSRELVAALVRLEKEKRDVARRIETLKASAKAAGLDIEEAEIEVRKRFGT